MLHHKYVKNVRPNFAEPTSKRVGVAPPTVAIWWQGLREFVHRILGHVQRFQGHARGVHRFDLVHHGAPDGNGPGYPRSEKPVDRTRTWPHNKRRSHRNHMFRFCLLKIARCLEIRVAPKIRPLQGARLRPCLEEPQGEGRGGVATPCKKRQLSYRMTSEMLDTWDSTPKSSFENPSKCNHLPFGFSCFDMEPHTPLAIQPRAS